MDQQLQEILELVVTGGLSLLTLVVTGLVSWGAKSIKQWLDSKAHMASFSCATGKLETLVMGATMEMEQTLVRQLKEDDKWDAETAKMVRDTAVGIVKRQLGERGLEELKGCLGLALADIDGIIRTKIEAFVGQSGTGQGPVVAPGK